MSVAAPERPPRGRRALLEILETLGLTVVIFLVVQTFVAQPFRVEGASMETTLLPDQYVLIDKLTPRWAPYQRGDIVVLHPPPGWSGSNGTPFIKRVIGVPGDHVELRDGRVWVNGAAIAEPYVFVEDGVNQRSDPLIDGTSSWDVPAGDVFVMGDHRGDSADSRIFGPIEIAKVIGRAWLRYWPIDTFGVLPAATYGAGGVAP